MHGQPLIRQIIASGQTGFLDHSKWPMAGPVYIVIELDFLNVRKTICDILYMFYQKYAFGILVYACCILVSHRFLSCGKHHPSSTP